MGKHHDGRADTTHDWSLELDTAHLDAIRANPRTFAPNGVVHLVLEVVAYPVDEAMDQRRGHVRVVLHADESIEVTDDGRGTDTRVDSDGHPTRKPVLATKDLRFFDAFDPEILPDGHPRRGMSVVTALSSSIVHINHRANGSWSQRYESGLPVGDLEPVTPVAGTGTTIRFVPDDELVGNDRLNTQLLRRSVAYFPGSASIDVVDQRF